MQVQIIDRVESKRAEKASKLFFYLGMASLILVTLKICLRQNRTQPVGYWFDLLVITFPIYFMVKGYKGLKNRMGQFIEWQEHQILYKLRENTTEHCIPIEIIKEVNIGLEEISLITIEGKRTLNIADFTDYETIKRIKKNFENIKNYIA